MSSKHPQRCAADGKDGIGKATATATVAAARTGVVTAFSGTLEQLTREAESGLVQRVRASSQDGASDLQGALAVLLAMTKHLLPRRGRQAGGHVLLLATTESEEEVAGLRAELGEAGIRSLPFHRFGRVADARRAIDALLSVSIDSEGDYAGDLLWEAHRIPHIKPGVPVGIEGTARWLAAVGGALGRERDVMRVIEQRELAPDLEKLSPYSGARVYVSGPSARAFAVAELIGEVGLTPVGLGVSAVAAQDIGLLPHVEPELPVLVGECQAREELELLQGLKPELVVGSGSAAVHALHLGIPVVDLQGMPILGFRGVSRVAESIRRRLANPALTRSLGEDGGG